MAWYDFLFKLGPSSPKEIDSVMQATDKAREGHYILAHHALRSVALDDPLFYLGVLASPERSKFLAQMIDAVAEQCEGRPLGFSANDLAVYPGRVGSFPTAVVQMPDPIAPPEAYFTALVLLMDANGELPDGLSELPVRYFTLERGVSLDGTIRRVLCEWDKTGHSNFGDGPDIATLDGFLATIGSVLRTGAGPATGFMPGSGPLMDGHGPAPVR
jgi:hypothetical protein